MDYDYRNRAAPPYRPAGAGPPFYPRVGQAALPPIGRGSPINQQTSNASSGLGIRVVLKPEYQMNLPPELVPITAEVPRCNFQYDFEFERKILAEAGKGSQSWSKIASENQPSKAAAAPSSSMGPMGGRDAFVGKYASEGLPHEAASLGVLNYGDNPVKVREFVRGFNLLREMGFASKNVAEALAMYDNDTDKAIAHFLNSS